ncbi:TonB-dependent receptor [Novosphingobium sp. AP12]|uniref:TonB-dependent receptor n=1 Tax=Novosphingobium sp. AP12 TaxID=1144305 RepID=UPI000271EC0F|nr:TonB-dependent receptor [Novosphingobium sp. AP12]EJL34403.1 outer membrane receptor protein [Novosphingobium sp. AP12]
MNLRGTNGASMAVLAISLLIVPDTAFAQVEEDSSGNGEIVVTAQRRAERSVDVPITVTTLGADQLATANARDLVDIAKVTPSLRFDSAAGFTQPTIRGIGTSVVTSGGGANVGIYVDGFYSPNPLASNSQLMNVQSVQVLKGPQGTLFGRNTTGGAILIQTAEPSEEPGGKFKASFGRFNDLLSQGYVTGGIAPGVAVDLEGMYRYGEGFLTNIANGDGHAGQYDSYSLRAGLKVNVGERGSLVLRYMRVKLDDPRPVSSNAYVDPVLGIGAPFFAPPGTFTTDPDLVAKDQPGIFRSKSDTFQGTLKLDLGLADFTSYTQYRTEKVNQSQDLDVSAVPLFQIGIPVNDKTFSQEILLNSKPGGALQWTAGLFYFSNKDTFQTYADTAGAFRDPDGPTRLGGSSTTTKSYAAFADATYELSPKLFVTAGARYAHDAVSDAYYDVGTTKNPVPSIKAKKLTPRLVIRYKPTEQSSIYASYTQGYKAAVIDVGGSCQNPPAFSCNQIKPENVNAYEVGAKFGNRVLTLETAGFYYDYKNLQVSSYLADGRANITNAASSEIYGLEGSVRLRLVEGLELNAGASWTHARYKNFDNAPVYVRSGCADPSTCPFSFVIASGTTLRNVTMQRTPEFTGSLGAVYKTGLAGGELALSGNLYYTSKFFFGPSGVQFPQKGYEVASARIQWTDPSDAVTVALWGDNLTNKRYLTSMQYNSFGLGANWNAPVTYGVELGFSF